MKLRGGLARIPDEHRAADTPTPASMRTGRRLRNETADLESPKRQHPPGEEIRRVSLRPTGHREEERPAVSVFAWEEVGADEIPSACVDRGCGDLGEQLPPGEEIRRKSFLPVSNREEEIADHIRRGLGGG